jgi:hypothetical protein
MLRIAVLGLILAGVEAAPAVATEWWQGSYADDGAKACEDNDSIATYSSSKLDLWEGSCDIKKTQKIKGIDAVILDMTCDGEGEELGPRRELLVSLGNGRMVRYPYGSVYRRCADLQVQGQEACPFNQRLFRSETFGEFDAAYQELQFVEGAQQGKATITQFRNDKPEWTSHTNFVCSNGASICQMTFSRMEGGEMTVVYEEAQIGNNAPTIVVFPGLRQSVYQTEQYATSNRKSYGGLVADLLNGYAPEDDELTIPYNIYKYSGCKR